MKSYFIKQKLIGVLTIIVTILLMIFAEDDTFALITIPIGVMLIFSKEMIWMDSYYCQVKKDEESQK